MRSFLTATIVLHLVAGNHRRTIRAARLLNVFFRAEIRERHLKALRPYLLAYFSARVYSPLAREFCAGKKIKDAFCARLTAQALLYMGHIESAQAHARTAVTLSPHDNLSLRTLGVASYLAGDVTAAKGYLYRSVRLAPETVMAHHNYASRNSHRDYRPADWELRHAGELVIYDLLHQTAEESFLSGDAVTSMRVYQTALDYQSQIAKDFKFPAILLKKLAKKFGNFDKNLPLRILPTEWVTQFGHIGLLDAYVKMIRLGLAEPANYVVLAPPEKVVNHDFLSMWEGHFLIVEDKSLCDELFPYIRYVGENFMAARGQDRMAEPWTHKAARAQVAWSEKGLPPVLQLSDEIRSVGESTLRDLGLNNSDWYVGLHVREGGYYGEMQGGGSRHRNSSIEDYFPAVREIVARGGTVIRLGDSSMTPLPPMKGVIDYPHTSAKSPLMDLFILATSRFLIGTTSGLTTAALAFGTPMVLVNCISNDPQLWTDQADFILKKIYSRRLRRYLTLAETYRQPFQGMLINDVLLDIKGYEIHDNSPEEICTAILYKLNKTSTGWQKSPQEKTFIDAFDAALASNKYNFGAARPVADFIAGNPLLLSPSDARTAWADEARNDNDQIYCPPVAAEPAALPGK